jgi:2-iminobutanoate/2-iminopropanoate deaminase
VLLLLSPRVLIAGDLMIVQEQTLRNLGAVLASAGASLQDVVKTTVFITDMNNFAKMNEAYAAVCRLEIRCLT